MRYTDLDLAGITKILRAHATQILPPGMRELTNVYVARSDNSITLRPDFEQEITDMISLSEDIQGTVAPEYLTGIYSILDYEAYIYFSNIGPLSSENSERVNLSSIYDEGTITTDGVRGVVVGSNTEWLRYAWEGCLIRESGSDDWYRIVAVKSDQYLVTQPAMPALSGSEYDILRTHPMTNGAWPVQFERLGDLLVYNPVRPTIPVDKGKISGPFYTDVGKADVFGVWKEFTPEIEAVEVEARTLWAGEYGWPYFQPPLNEPKPFYLAGTNGAIASLASWVSDFNADVDGWDDVKEKYEFIGENAKVVYPKGSAFPMPTDAILLPLGADSEVVFLVQGFYALRDGSITIMTDADLDDLLTRTEEELVNGGPYLPDTVYGTQYLISPPAFGANFNTYIFGENGQIHRYGATGLEPTDVETPIYGATQFEFYDPYLSIHIPPGIYQIFVGGVDEDGPTILLNGNVLGDEYHRVLTDAAETELYDVTYMLSTDDGVDGIGKLIAVGAYGTIITSDDSGLTWSASHPIGDVVTTNHLRHITTDGHAGFAVMAVGDNGTCIVTIDGEEWDSLQITEKDILALSYNPQRGEFCMLESGGTDAIRVKRRLRYGVGNSIPLKRIGVISSDFNDSIYCAIWDGSQFIAAGRDIWTSPTGETWTKRSFGDATVRIAALAHNGAGVIVGVGNKGAIVRSADSGATWSVVFSAEANPDIDGAILSVIWDDYNFFCCGDKVILKSADGATWAEDDTFDFDDQPVFLVYNGDYGTNALNDTQYGFTETVGPGNLHVICQSGNIYLNYNDKTPEAPDFSIYDVWTKWEDTSYASPEEIPPRDEFKVKIKPTAAIGSRSTFRMMAVDGSDIQNFFSLASNGSRQYYVEHQHIAGTVADPAGSKAIEPQEPGVLRIRKNSDGTVPDYYPRSRVMNGLLVMNQLEHKTYSVPIALWLHGTNLMVSTDNGQTWSKGYPLTIPIRNSEYVEPVSGEPAQGGYTIGFDSSVFNIAGKHFMPMVTDNVDAFVIAWNSFAGGIGFYSISWDGLGCDWGDTDTPQVAPEVIPPIQSITLNQLDSITVTSFDVSFS